MKEFLAALSYNRGGNIKTHWKNINFILKLTSHVNWILTLI